MVNIVGGCTTELARMQQRNVYRIHHVHTHTYTHTHTKVLQLTSDIEGVHRELAVGAERHSDLQQKSEAQLRQVQVSLSFYVYIYSNIPYLEDVTVGRVASVDRWWQAHRQGGLKGFGQTPLLSSK